MTRDDEKALVTAPDLTTTHCPLPPLWRAASENDGFYLWDIHAGQGDGPCGVTDQPHLATARLVSALTEAAAGDAEGLIRQVRLDRLAGEPSYIKGQVLIRLRRDPHTGEIVRVCD
ncbi:hypothetical protein ACI2LC_42155 [Nonomuraea wenchangensis]|uniref:hypothetical protein n=1 Tax=Nonomuraea wenchangensis TaxID=568860 RepID=UPI00384B06A0